MSEQLENADQLLVLKGIAYPGFLRAFFSFGIYCQHIPMVPLSFGNNTGYCAAVIVLPAWTRPVLLRAWLLPTRSFDIAGDQR